MAMIEKAEVDPENERKLIWQSGGLSSFVYRDYGSGLVGLSLVCERLTRRNVMSVFERTSDDVWVTVCLDAFDAKKPTKGKVVFYDHCGRIRVWKKWSASKDLSEGQVRNMLMSKLFFAENELPKKIDLEATFDLLVEQLERGDFGKPTLVRLFW